MRLYFSAAALYLSAVQAWTPPAHWTFTGIRRSAGSELESSSFDSAAMSPCVIKVVGVGGGGCNAVDRMLESNVGHVDFWALNTDAQALGRSGAKGSKTLAIGQHVTRGLGAGGNPAVGELAAQESIRQIYEMVQDTDLCFVTSGMGGGTGSGAAPVVAQVAKEAGCLTVGIVTKPFAFEGRRRMKQALAAIERLKENVDTVIVVSNDRLLEIIPDDTPMERAFAVADDILRQGVVGISDIIIKPGLINVDFADVRSIMSGAGTALMGIGIGEGRDAATEAAAAAISSPLLETTIENAKGVVFNISGGPNLSLHEVNQAAKLIYNTVEYDANVIFGALVDESLGDTISITVLATGFTESALPENSVASNRQNRNTFNQERSSNSVLLNGGFKGGLRREDRPVQSESKEQGVEEEDTAPAFLRRDRDEEPSIGFVPQEVDDREEDDDEHEQELEHEDLMEEPSAGEDVGSTVPSFLKGLKKAGP